MSSLTSIFGWQRSLSRGLIDAGVELDMSFFFRSPGKFSTVPSIKCYENLVILKWDRSLFELKRLHFFLVAVETEHLKM